MTRAEKWPGWAVLTVAFGAVSVTWAVLVWVAVTVVNYARGC